MNKQIIKTLQDIGLSENEAAVYVAGLSLGPTTAIKIARQTGIKRPTVYTVIESLKEKGLMNIEIKGFKQHYVSENPDRLKEVLEQRKKELNKKIPELQALFNLKGEEGSIKYYEGLEGIKSVYEGMIKDIKPHEDYVVISNLDKVLELDEKWFKDFFDRRAKLNINIRLLLQDTEKAREFKKYAKNINAKIKLLPSKTNLNTNLVITPQRVMIHQLKYPIVAIVIENKSTIEMQQELFEIIWNTGEDLGNLE